VIWLGAVVLGLWIGSLVAAYHAGKRAFRQARRKQMALPPLPTGGIMAYVSSVTTVCPDCGKVYRRHPAQTEQRCNVCLVVHLDKMDQDAWEADPWHAKGGN
jgi:hypothetical protein